MALVTGTSDVAVNIQGYYDRNLLDRALPALIHGRFGQTRPLPKNSGTRINFRRYNSLAANTTPLSEGVTPTGKKASNTDIYATVQQYGDFLTYSDWLLMTGLDPTLAEFSDLLGEQMGLSIDQLTRATLVGGTNVRYANAVAGRTSIVTAPSTSDMKSIVRNLEGSNAKKIRKMIMGGPKIGTRPVAPAFYAITHTDCRQDFEALDGFIKVEEYAAQKNVPEEEFGAWGNVRFLASTNSKIYADGGGSLGSTGLISTSGSDIDVYVTLVLADNAYGHVPLQKGNVKNIVKKMGSAGSDDPLDQRGTSGWKAAYVAKILNDDFMVRFEHGVTDYD